MPKINVKFKIYFPTISLAKLYFPAFLLILSSFAAACRTPLKKTDLRSLVPSDASVYLEINNVKETLESMTANPAFRELANSSSGGGDVDFSALENMQLAIAVANFELSENQIASDNSVLNFKPKFVAIVETHAWSWQTRSFTENQINNFVAKKLGQDARLEKINKFGGEFFTWTAAEGNRQVFAFVRESLIYFGNDAAAIEKCLAVQSGEVESLEKNESFARNYTAGQLALGYVSPAGIAQFADVLGVGVAAQTTEEMDGRSFIARVLPQITRKTTREIFWTANKFDFGIEDKFTVALDSEISESINNSLATSDQNRKNTIKFLPSEIVSATRYNLKNPLEAWRNLLLLTARNTDPLSGKFLFQFSGALLEPYKIADAEKFLSSIESDIITAQFDENSEKSVFIVEAKNTETLKQSISKEINFEPQKMTKQENAEIWFSEDAAAAFVENILILGDRESVLKCLLAERNARNSTNNQRRFQTFAESNSVAATFGKDFDSAEKIAEVLAGKKDQKRKLATFYLTETNFNKNGFERRTVSDFGLLGTILKQWEN